MFDLLTGNIDRPFHEKAVMSTVVSGAVHATLIAAVLLLPLLYVTEQMPTLPLMNAFVGMPAVPPPPPPPPAPRRAANVPKTAPEPPAKANRFAAPIEAPATIGAERDIVPSEPVGVEGGVEGCIEGGVVGGIVGGLLEAPPRPPPPPPPPRTPVRIGGQITAPALIYRVEPKYPDFAAQAQIEGLVILEATVDTEGRVQAVQVLRSHGLLDQAAMDAVKQWRYSPLVLNGQPFPFVLTVTVSFSLRR